MERAAGMYLKGATHADIGRALGVSARTAGTYIEEVRLHWLDSALRDYDQAKMEQLAKIDLLERTYWEAWEASRQDKETIQIDALPKGEWKATSRSEGQTGNAAFLDGVMKCIDKRCKILGLDAPTRNINVTIPWDKLNDEQIDLIIAGEDPKKVLPAHLIIDATPANG